MALSPPGYGKPSLLSYQEVEEVVRLFGKVTHQMLSTKKWSETSGLTGLEWDCLKVVPEVLVLWLTIPQVLLRFSQHWSTGEQLSMAQLTGLVSARNHMAGYDLCNELYKAAYDIAFYTEDYENEQYQDLVTRLVQVEVISSRWQIINVVIRVFGLWNASNGVLFTEHSHTQDCI